ncbi:hypothetical protein RJT34_03025 [Clitoria ternatea]|uniref:Uncharacterized protein n=1 Tax=Clitoria ternatea TaxID=43366 RepID=A0AAN9KKY3_CLITE
MSILHYLLDGRELEVLFDNFPYLKHKEHAKYTIDLATINPRILLSGPARSEIFQGILVKALALWNSVVNGHVRNRDVETHLRCLVECLSIDDVCLCNLLGCV